MNTITLKTYIEQLGDDEAAKRLGITARTAGAYRRGEREPRPEQARKWVREMGGLLTLESIYGWQDRAA